MLIRLNVDHRLNVDQVRVVGLWGFRAELIWGPMQQLILENLKINQIK